MLFRKRPPAKPSQPWMKWAVLAFLGVALINNLGKHGTDSSGKGTPNVFEVAKENITPAKLLDLEGYKKAFFPESEAPLNMKDIALGKGPPAICGQEVKIVYDVYVDSDKPTEINKTASFRIGAGQ